MGERKRKPDFRLRLANEESWTYFEVTQPDIAEAQIKVDAIPERLAGLVRPIKSSFALEVFLRREPTDSETAPLLDLIPQFCVSGEMSKDLPDLAVLSLNSSAPGTIVLLDHPGEPNVPRLESANAIWGPDEPRRHISVRMAYADDRAEAFLRKEAKQLPSMASGAIMVQMSRAPGGIKSWESVLKCRFQPKLYTRVRGVCHFQSGQEPTPRGVAWVPEAKIILNPYASRVLPPWIPAALSRAAPEHHPL